MKIKTPITDAALRALKINPRALIDCCRELELKLQEQMKGSVTRMKEGLSMWGPPK